MDGPCETQLWVEGLSEIALSEIQWQYCKTSIDQGFYPGKSESKEYKTLQMLTNEIRIRMAAE